MVDKHFLDSFIRLNHIAPDASPEVLEKALAEARWLPEDITEALAVYRGDGASVKQLNEKRQEKMLFRPDMDWSSSKLSSLLGTDVVIDPKSFPVPAAAQAAHLGKKIMLGISMAAIAFIIAGTIGVSIMYALQIGPFSAEVESII